MCGRGLCERNGKVFLHMLGAFEAQNVASEPGARLHMMNVIDVK